MPCSRGGASSQPSPGISPAVRTAGIGRHFTGARFGLLQSREAIACLLFVRSVVTGKPMDGLESGHWPTTCATARTMGSRGRASSSMPSTTTLTDQSSQRGSGSTGATCGRRTSTRSTLLPPHLPDCLRQSRRSYCPSGLPARPAGWVIACGDRPLTINEHRQADTRITVLTAAVRAGAPARDDGANISS